MFGFSLKNWDKFLGYFQTDPFPRKERPFPYEGKGSYILNINEAYFNDPVNSQHYIHIKDV